MNLSYTGWVGLGGLAGLGWLLWRNCRSLADVADALTRVFLIGLAALVCGRIGYVLLNLDFFAHKPDAMFNLATPGLAEQTALLGAWAGWVALAPARWKSPRAYVGLAALIGVGASVGCMGAGCAYGREVFWQDGVNSLGWLLRADLPDAYSIRNPRLPTQAMLAVWLIGLGLIFLWHTPGQAHRSPLFRAFTPGLFIGAVFIGDFFIQFLRADPPGFVMVGLRGWQWLDLICVGLICGIYFVTMRLAHKRAVKAKH